MKFTELGLSKSLQKAVAEQGYDTPSPIQAKAIPAVLTGKDVMAAAQTGTGKTAGFTLPILERLSQGKPARFNAARCLILTPTRELAAQVEASVVTYGKHLNLRSTVVFGGVKINPQMQRLRRGVDILVATPGRLLDLHSQNAVRFDDLEVLVLDEADRMLDMGFIHDIKRIIKLVPKKRQNLMFSATFSREIKQLAQAFINHPIEISVNPENSTADTVAQKMHPVDKKKKSALLMHLVSSGQWQQVLVFCRTKHGSNRLATYLDKYGISSAAIHGNKSQGARTRALAGFKANKIRVLVATDIAARGIDIDQLPHVVNFDLPNVPEDYVHRIGRTGRAGAEGEAVSLVSADEFKQLFDIEKLIGKTLPREYVDDFEPEHDVPQNKAMAKRFESDYKPSQPKRKKPKKPKQKPFVKASVKAKWANKSHGAPKTEAEKQAEFAREQMAKSGEKPVTTGGHKKHQSQGNKRRKKPGGQSGNHGQANSGNRRKSQWKKRSAQGHANGNKSRGNHRNKQQKHPA